MSMGEGQTGPDMHLTQIQLAAMFSAGRRRGKIRDRTYDLTQCFKGKL